MIDFEPEGRLYIDGEFREAAAGGRFDVRSPSDESVVGTAADAQAEDVAAAVGAARRAADETSWSTDHAFRQRVLRQLQDALRKRCGGGQAAPDRRGGHPGLQHRRAYRRDDRGHDVLQRPDRPLRLADRRRRASGRRPAEQPPGPLRGVRRGRGDHAVERAVHDRHLEDPARAGHRQHPGAQDRPGHPADRRVHRQGRARAHRRCRRAC